MKKFFELLAVSLLGFSGGALAPMALGWFRSVPIAAPGDAVSIANTYIVFTTLIFVGFTVVLGIAGYVFTQQFSASKESQENQIIDELRSRLGNDEKLAIKLLDSLLKNADVRNHLAEQLENKMDEIISERLSDSQAVAASAASEAAAIEALAGKLRANGKGEQL